MSSSSTSSKSVCVFFGATGGCMNMALTLALKNGHQCTALARTPSKLTDMLLAAGTPQEAISTRLSIVQGDIKDPSAVKQTISHNPAGCDAIFSGIGAIPTFKDYDATLCQDAMAVILGALGELRPARKPALVAISTIGVTDGARDIPLLYIPLYRTLLDYPRRDKGAMEAAVYRAAAAADPQFSGYTFIRPSLLSDKEPSGFANISAGDEDSPMIAWSIPRKDVGIWVYEELIKGDSSKWANRKVSLSTSGGNA